MLTFLRVVIAIDQDPLGIQGIRINGSDMNTGASVTNIWGRPLSTGGWAVLFFNNDSGAMDITCDLGCFKVSWNSPTFNTISPLFLLLFSSNSQTMGYDSSATLNIRDVWAHTNNGTVTVSDGYTVSSIPPNGGSVTVIFSS